MPLASSNNVNYTIISSTSFLLTWEPPALNQRRGYLTHYIVTIAADKPAVRQRDARPSEKYQLSHDMTELMIIGLNYLICLCLYRLFVTGTLLTTTDLERFGAYSVSISAATSAGEGPPTNIRVNIVTGGKSLCLALST